ncbi:MAG: hypothetical protein HUU50_02225 [Candidatus Brocadiae bacterium]|nr:hypothetical protein [Candidatus Brocadiia bacterium]
MQTCSYCLREIPECISFCFYCNKSANVSFLKLPDPDLSHFLDKIKESDDLKDLDLFDYLSKKTIRIDIKEEVEIQSTEEIAQPVSEEIPGKEKTLPEDIQEEIKILPEQEISTEKDKTPEPAQKEILAQEAELLEKEALEEVYFAISLENDIKQEKEEGKEQQDQHSKKTPIAEDDEKKIFFDSELEESQYISLTDVLTQRQKTQKRPLVQPQVAITKKDPLPEIQQENTLDFTFENHIPENCDYLLFGDIPEGNPTILGRCQEEKFQYMIFEQKPQSPPPQKRPFWFWFILFIGIVLGIFIGKLF